MRTLFRRLLYLLRWSRHRADLRDEIETHRSLRQEARDPMTFTSTAAVLVAVGVLAAWVPARRAARLDPAAVLREG